MRHSVVTILAACIGPVAPALAATDQEPWLEIECRATHAENSDHEPSGLFTKPSRYSFVAKQFSDAKNMDGVWFVSPERNFGIRLYRSDPHKITAYLIRPGTRVFNSKEGMVNLFEIEKNGAERPTYQTEIEFDRVNGTFEIRDIHTDGSIPNLPLGAWFHRESGNCVKAPARRF